MSSWTRTAEAASAASAAALSPDSQCQMWLFCLSVAAIGPEDERVRLERLVRVDDHLQRLVVDLDRSDAVGRDVLGGGDDRGNFLAWYMTVSVGSTICLSPARVGIQCRPAFSRSAPVMTARTPGILSASVASMPLIVAWAYGLRTMSSQSLPGRSRRRCTRPRRG